MCVKALVHRSARGYERWCTLLEQWLLHSRFPRGIALCMLWKGAVRKCPPFSVRRDLLSVSRRVHMHTVYTLRAEASAHCMLSVSSG